jgi:hypothetical protein
MATKTRTGKKDMTKAELVRVLQTKIKKASPMVKWGAFSTKDLMRLKKSELQRRLKKAHVVTKGTFKGDVEFY